MDSGGPPQRRPSVHKDFGREKNEPVVDLWLKGEKGRSLLAGCERAASEGPSNTAETSELVKTRLDRDRPAWRGLNTQRLSGIYSSELQNLHNSWTNFEKKKSHITSSSEVGQTG